MEDSSKARPSEKPSHDKPMPVRQVACHAMSHEDLGLHGGERISQQIRGQCITASPTLSNQSSQRSKSVSQRAWAISFGFGMVWSLFLTFSFFELQVNCHYFHSSSIKLDA